MTGKTGFTLVELMAVIVIMGIAATISVPAFGKFMQTWKLSSEANGFASTLRTARSAAVMKNINTVVEFDKDAETYVYYEDLDSDGTHDVGEYMSANHQLPSGIFIDSTTLSADRITFGPRGNANESGSITLENVHTKSRVINIFGGTGNIRVD